MTQNSVVVIDGSNIATEGRSVPSLAQLDEAVRSFLEEYPHDQFIVVVDATFEHRIDPSERQMYDEALAANELLTPPAGTIGRGDAFILAIAEKANATVFSNDSFQEFHGDFDWLFDEGRLIGGKPVPVIGWVFTARTPVRGQKSRQATRSASRKRVRGGETASAKSASRASPRRSASSPAAHLPMPMPRTPPPGPARRREAEEEAPPAGDGGRDRSERPRRGGRKRAGSPSTEPVNEGLAFVTFISDHAVGETVEGEVTEFSSHGAYVSVGDARCYVPLKYLGDPPPRAARDVLERGAVRSFVVQAIDGPRRAIDLALPGFEQLDGITDHAEGIDEDDDAPATDRADAEAGRAEVAGEQEARPKRRTRPRTTPAEASDAEPVRRRTRARKGEDAVDAVAPAPRRRARRTPGAAAPVSEAASADDAVEEAPKPRRRARKVAPAAQAEVVEAPAVEAPVVKEKVPRRRTRTSVPSDTDAEVVQVAERPAPRRRTRASTSAADAPAPLEVSGSPPRGRGRRVAAPERVVAAAEGPGEALAEAPAEALVTAPAKRPTKKAATKKAATKKAATKKAATTKAPAQEAPPKKEGPAKKKAATKKAATKKAATTMASAEGTAAEKASAEKATPRRAGAKTAAATAGGGDDVTAAAERPRAKRGRDPAAEAAVDGGPAPRKRAPAKRPAKKTAASDPAGGTAKAAGKGGPARRRATTADDD